LHQDGHYIWVSVNTAPIINAEATVIAELKKKNTELEKLLKLREEALALREDMSNMIIHDLRNPLTNILLSAEIIKKYGDRPDQEGMFIKKAEQILTYGKRLKSLIDSLLFMAKLESGKIIFNPQPTDLHALGMSLISDFELSAKAHKIELEGELPKPGNSVFIDPIILRRVIENLLSNAIKFSPPNSQVRLKMEYLYKNRFRVRTIDNGSGVSPERTNEIFKKFEIGAIKQNVSQIGLGLAFCKMAVEA
ncbi:MAG: sensor histidine kinase, partial [Microcystaceae cyanobacterium]